MEKVYALLFQYVGIGTRLALCSVDWLTTREFAVLVPEASFVTVQDTSHEAASELVRAVVFNPRNGLSQEKRYLSWTFEEAPRLVVRATREHPNGTIFEEDPTFDETGMAKEEPPEETDIILHDDDDDAKDPESTGTAVAEAVVTFFTVASPKSNTLLMSAYGKPPPKP